jgi:hypothetical protein
MVDRGGDIFLPVHTGTAVAAHGGGADCDKLAKIAAKQLNVLPDDIEFVEAVRSRAIRTIDAIRARRWDGALVAGDAAGAHVTLLARNRSLGTSGT